MTYNYMLVFSGIHFILVSNWIFFLLQTHIITYSALNVLTKRYNAYSTDKYKTIQYFSRLLTLFTMRCLHYMDKVTLTL